MAENGVRSEDVLGQKWDRCVSDTAIKFSNAFYFILRSDVFVLLLATKHTNVNMRKKQ